MEGGQENNKNSVGSSCMNDLSRDLVHELSNQTNPPNEKQKNVLVAEEEENEKLHLSLGSMNNIFGVEPAVKKLRRWSSVLNSSLITSATVENVLRKCHVPLMGSFFMPAEVEEELRRRKAVKSKEARKKRMEKMRIARFVNKGVGIDDGNGGGVRNCGGGSSNGAENVNALSPSSHELHKSGSIGFSELLRQQIEAAARQNPEMRNPFVHPPPALSQGEQLPIIRAADVKAEEANDVVRTELPDMPYVTTRGPKGNRIEGLLYKYLKADDIKIVCVCHGIFLSPAEFIRHAGGGDVEYPLRHIIVTPSPLS